jgi:hypothetical protein
MIQTPQSGGVFVLLPVNYEGSLFSIIQAITLK